ncbi:MAG TPA: hypothetical protein ENK43_17405 [Planctomycetes bacterium]|nr:hypothetical protein [Planctomycetota bacterium]
MKRWIVVDASDGPESGGGAALARALRRRGVEHEAWILDSHAGGAPAGSRCVASGALARALKTLDDDSRVVPGSLEALRELRSALDELGSDAPKSLRRLLDEPSGRAALFAASRWQLPHAPFALIERPEREAMKRGFAASHLMGDDGRVRPVADGEAAWFESRALIRGEGAPAVLVGMPGAALHAIAMIVKDGQPAAAGAVVVDEGAPLARAALARSVRPNGLRTFLSKVARRFDVDGIKTVWAVSAPGEEDLLLMTAHPTPPDWLELFGADGGVLVGALLDDDGARSETKRFPLLSAGLYHASVPVDERLDETLILQRLEESE